MVKPIAPSFDNIIPKKLLTKHNPRPMCKYAKITQILEKGSVNQIINYIPISNVRFKERYLKKINFRFKLNNYKIEY